MKLKKNKLFHNKTLIFFKDIDIEKLLVSNKISFGEKNNNHFIGYLFDDNEIQPLHIMLPKTIVYVKSHDVQTKSMYFLIEDDDLLEIYNTTWNKVSADLKKEFDSEPVYNKKEK